MHDLAKTAKWLDRKKKMRSSHLAESRNLIGYGHLYEITSQNASYCFY